MKKHVLLIVGAIMIGSAIPGFSGVADFDAYVAANLCSERKTTECLEVLEIKACQSGCYRRGYNWRNVTPGRLELHLTLNDYLRHLRNAAVAAPTQSTGYTLDMSFEDLLWHQVQMFFVAPFPGTNVPQARFYDEDFNELSLAAVKTRNIVRASNFHAVTWVNEGDRPSAMTQADMGLWFITLAMNWVHVGLPDRADEYLRYSERVFRPYGVRANDGGVRNNKPNNRCFGNLFCYWFHSQEVQTDDSLETILNKNLHAIRDALIAYEVLATWRDEGLNGYALPSEFNTSHIEQLKEWGRGGLFQLAYGVGNRVDPSAPPNLEEFLVDDPSGQPVQYATYKYYLGDGAHGIKPLRTCHYHYHSAKVLADILILINPEPKNVIPGREIASDYFADDPYFKSVYFKLLYDRNTGDTRSCNNRSYIPPSRRVMTGVPTAEIYRASDVKLGDGSFQAWCEKCQPCKFQCGFGDLADAKAFYDLAYTDCIF